MRYGYGGLKRVAASTRSATYGQGPNSGISLPTGICRRQSRTLTSSSLAVVHQFPRAQLDVPGTARRRLARGAQPRVTDTPMEHDGLTCVAYVYRRSGICLNRQDTTPLPAGAARKQDSHAEPK
jgi:hypothetical protein